MYIPEYHRIRDDGEALRFARAHLFAILVSNSNQGPFATHLPVLVSESETGLVVRGHVARQNPHCQYLQGAQESLVIFHGPHAYISPSLYELRENVPTWNYAAVHMYGQVTTFNDPTHLLDVLHQIIHTFESEYMQQWSGLSEEYRQRMLHHIVGFELKVSRIEGKYKLSQNRSPLDQQSVIDSLGSSGDSVISGTAALMRAQGLGLKKEK